MDNLLSARADLVSTEVVKNGLTVVVVGNEKVGKTRLLREVATRLGYTFACAMEDDSETCTRAEIVDEFGYLWQQDPTAARHVLERRTPTIIGTHPRFWYKHCDQLFAPSSTREIVEYVTPYGDRREGPRLAATLVPAHLREHEDYAQRILQAARGYPGWMALLARSSVTQSANDLLRSLASFSQADVDMLRMEEASPSLQDWILGVATRPWTRERCPPALRKEALREGWCAPNGMEVISPPLCARLSLGS